MNYLAHLYLSSHSDQALLGSLLGDFVKGHAYNQYDDEIKHNILLHRKIDSFTDRHIKDLCSRNMLLPSRRRFAGIIIDVCYDHFLIKHWSSFAEDDCHEFISNAYAVLQTNQKLLPPRLQNILPLMVRENWLLSYKNIDGVEKALNRISTRLKRDNALSGPVEELHNRYGHFENEFLEFFPRLIEHVEQCHLKFT